MNEYKILFHPEAGKEFNKLDGSIRKVVLKQLSKLKHTPGLGEKLGHKAGLDLTGYRKMYGSREAELALLKRMEVKLNPLMAEACSVLESMMVRFSWQSDKDLIRKCSGPGGSLSVSLRL